MVHCQGLVPVKVDMEDNEHVMIYYLQGKRLWSQLSVSDVRNSTVSFLTDFKWFNRCVDVLYLIRTAEPRLWRCVCQCFVKTLETYTADSYLHVSENLIWWVKFQSCRAPYQRVSPSKPWLIIPHLAGAVSRDPCNCILPRFARQPLIQYSHVHACLSENQTACLACVSTTGSSGFTTCCQIKVGVAGGSSGSQDGVLRAAALSGHVWTIQHGCHQSIPGVCSCWVMASHWSPKPCRPREPAGSGLHIQQVVLGELHVWCQVSRVLQEEFLYTGVFCLSFKEHHR